jgi:hypothetical protein
MSDLHSVSNLTRDNVLLIHIFLFTSFNVKLEYSVLSLILLFMSWLLQLFMYSASRHESVLAEWRYSSKHSWPWHYMEVSGKLHALGALSKEKELAVPIG